MKKLVWLLAALAVMAWFMDSLWTSSVDLAHHYALVARLAEHFTLPRTFDNSLGEMNFYPHGSHFAAAMLGILTGSNLLGMHLLSLLSLLAIWGGLIYLVLQLPHPARWWALLCLLGLLKLNKWLNILQLHGAELIGNYFFAQVVAQAGLVLIVLIAYLFEREEQALWRRNLFIVVMAWVLAYVHLLPVVELLGLFGFLLLRDFLAHRNFARALGSLGWLLLATWLVVRHPSYAAMLEISKNEGAFGTAMAHKTGTIGAYALLVLLLAWPLLRAWLKMDEQQRQRWLVCKYIIFYSMSAAILALMQLIAFKFGYGSSYAVRKYMFSVDTALLLEITLALAWYVTRFSQSKIAVPAHGVAALSAIFALVTISPTYRDLDTSDLVNLERDLRTLERTSIAPQPGKYTYAMDLHRPDGSAYPSSLSYLFSIGVFKAPRSSIANDIFTGKKVTRMGLVGTIVTSSRSRVDTYSACRSLQTRYGLVLIDGQCWSRESGTVSVIYELSQEQPDWPCKLTGFGSAESFGRWSIVKKSSIVCTAPKINGGPAKKVLISAGAFLQRIAQQRVAVTLNGGVPQHYQFDPKHADQVLTIPLQADANGQVRLDLSMPDARTPASLGLGVDMRELGISIQSLEFQ